MTGVDWFIDAVAVGATIWASWALWRERARRAAMTPEQRAEEDERAKEEGQLW